jgi:hypothetical protein
MKLPLTGYVNHMRLQFVIINSASNFIQHRLIMGGSKSHTFIDVSAHCNGQPRKPNMAK